MAKAKKTVVRDIYYAERYCDLVSCPFDGGALLIYDGRCTSCISRCTKPIRRTLYKAFDGSDNLWCVHLPGIRVRVVRYECTTYTSWNQIGSTLFLRLRNLGFGNIYGLSILGERDWASLMGGRLRE